MTAQPQNLKKSSPVREQRRDVLRTLGAAGSVRVHLAVGNDTVAYRVMDISPGGMGLVTNQIRSTRLPTVAMDVLVIYRKGTRDEIAMPGTVRNVNFEMFGDTVVVRLGLSFGATRLGRRRRRPHAAVWSRRKHARSAHPRPHRAK